MKKLVLTFKNDEDFMTPEEFETSMNLLNMQRDTETFHRSADNLICEVMKTLGYEKGIEIFQKRHKWYS